MIVPERQDRRQDRDQDLMIERARKADPDPVSRPGLPGLDPLAELTREDTAARNREAPRPATVTHRADKDILLDRRGERHKPILNIRDRCSRPGLAIARHFD